MVLFLIGRRLIDYRAGILAVLIFSVSSWVIYFGFWTIPNVLGMVFLLLVIYMMIRYYEKREKRWIPLILLAAVAIIFTHILVAAWLIAAIVWFFIVITIKERRFNPLTFVIFAVIVGGIIASWVESGYWDNFVRFAQSGLNPNNIGVTLTPVNESTVTTAYYVGTLFSPFGETLFNYLGMVLGFVLAICGILWVLSKKNISYLSIFVVGMFVLFIFCGTVPNLFGITLIEGRWLYAGQIIGAVLSAAFLASTWGLWGRLASVLIIAVLAFLMIMGLPTNMDNDTFSKHQIVRYALTDGELKAMDYIMSHYEGTVGADAYYNYVGKVLPQYSGRLRNIDQNYLENDFVDIDCDIVVVRDAIAYEPFSYGEGRIYELLYDPNVSLIEAGYKVIYFNDEVKAYLRP